MKIIDLQSWAGPLETGRTSLPKMAIATDSATVFPKRPLFLPEIAEEWEMTIGMGCRISRLGKNIPKRFASRHYDAVTLIARALPQGFDPVDPRSSAIDSAYSLGEWIPVEDAGGVATLRSPESRELRLPPITTFDAAIESVSRHFTLKTGDIIIVPPPAACFKAEIGMHVEGELGDKPILTFNIK